MTPKKCMSMAKSLTNTQHMELEPLCSSELKKAKILLHISFQLIVFDASYIHSVSVIYMNTELKAVKIPSHD